MHQQVDGNKVQTKRPSFIISYHTFSTEVPIKVLRSHEVL